MILRHTALWNSYTNFIIDFFYFIFIIILIYKWTLNYSIKIWLIFIISLAMFSIFNNTCTTVSSKLKLIKIATACLACLRY